MQYILYHFEFIFSLPLLITRTWQPCYLAAAECYSEIIYFTHSNNLVSDCIHSCQRIPYVQSGHQQQLALLQLMSYNWFTLFYAFELLSLCTNHNNAIATSTTSSPATATPFWPSWESTHGFPGCTGKPIRLCRSLEYFILFNININQMFT